MALESATFIHQLNSANPAGSDRLQQGDDHIRLVKAALKATFPNLTGAFTLEEAFLNRLKDLVCPTGLIGILYGETVPTGWAICNGQTVNKSDGSGTIVTPDLRGRVVVGVSEAHVYGSTWGQDSYDITTATAGAHTHTATAASAGSHDHGGATGGAALTVAHLPAHSHFVAKLAMSAQRFSSGASSSSAVATDKEDQGDSNYNLTASTSEADRGASSKVGAGEAHSHTIADSGTHTHAITVSDVAAHSHTATVSASQPSMAFHYIMKI